jgi:hypothetical protein
MSVDISKYSDQPSLFTFSIWLLLEIKWHSWNLRNLYPKYNNMYESCIPNIISRTRVVSQI